ncbi:MAG: TolC family protein [Saprospiraceae bacterium]|nr:TolC family protein [Saprospiraceae bacterium]MDW8228915.1 TolC family protein [Saprospiraceae bacterium]
MRRTHVQTAAQHFILALALLLWSAAPSASQEVWNLERCIRHAQEANLLVRQAQTNARVALLSERQAKAGRLPSINANSTLGEQFGRTIDPATNQFVTSGITFNSIGLTAGLPLFAGGQIHHGIRQARWNAQAAKADAEQTANNLALQVAQAYLNVLLAEEQREIARRRVEQARLQLETTLKLIEAGSAPAADRFNAQAQLAREEQLAVQAQNSVELAMLALKQLLQLEPNDNLRIERPRIEPPTDAAPENLTLPAVYAIARETQPGVKAAHFRLKSAETGVTLAKSAYFPTLTLFASLNTNYSSQFRDFNNPRILGTVLGPPVIVRINEVDVPVQQYVNLFEFPRLSYLDQIEQNFGQGIGLQISVPIYQNGRNRLSVERARLNVISAQLQENQAQQQLKNDIQTAIANARASRLQLDAAQKTYEFMQAAFANTERRYQLGAANLLEFTTARNNRDNAENDLLIARYDYVFRLKILDFYLGKEIRL